jgi:hypothetical protein
MGGESMSDKVARAVFLWVYFSLIAVGIFFVACGCESASVNNRDLLDYLPTTTTTTIPPADAMESVQGFTHATPITDSLELTGMYSSKATFSGNVREWGSNELTGECHLFIFRAGKWVGGKFDHIRDNTFLRDFNNVYNGYQVWSTLKPKRGEMVAILFINYAKTKRTNAVFAEWKGN